VTFLPSGIVAAAVLQSWVLAGMLVLHAPNTAANRTLAGTLLVTGGVLITYSLGWTGRAEVSPWLAFLPVNLSLALGPLVYAYVVGLTSGAPPRQLSLHLAPAGAQLLYLLVLSLSTDPLRHVWKEEVHDDWVKPAIEGAVLLSMLAYGIASLRLLRRYRSWLSRERSDADQFAAHWVGHVVLALLVTLAILAALRLYTWWVGELETGPLFLWLAGWGAWFGVEGWRHAFRRFPSMLPAHAVVAVTSNDWAASGKEWRDRIEAGGWWRQPSLTLADTARRLGTNTAYLSRALNEGLGLNFNELVNAMRAAEAARLIDTSAGGDLLDIAYEVGFSSKATFNRAFRARHGCSPSAYRARLRSEKIDAIE